MLALGVLTFDATGVDVSFSLCYEASGPILRHATENASLKAVSTFRTVTIPWDLSSVRSLVRPSVTIWFWLVECVRKDVNTTSPGLEISEIVKTCMRVDVCKYLNCKY